MGTAVAANRMVDARSLTEPRSGPRARTSALDGQGRQRSNPGGSVGELHRVGTHPGMSRGFAQLPAGVRIGEVVAGRYRIDRVLGAGAMGVVVEAYHRLLDQKVAIKFLLSGALAYAGSVERFVREARATARIRSEHVVGVLDVAVLETG